MCYSEWGVNALKNYVAKATTARAAYLAGPVAGLHVQFSSNSKLDGVLAVGTLPVIDCGGACKDCKSGCYAVRHTVGRCRQALNRCARNSAILAADRDRFFAEISRAMKSTRVFRFNTEGEVLDYDYFRRAVEVSAENERTEVLIFTKRADVVNTYMDNGGTIPTNMHVILSAWSDVSAVNNPYKFPISAPDFSGADVPAKYRRSFDPCGLRVVECCGDCMACYLSHVGCFGAVSGDVVRFAAH